MKFYLSFAAGPNQFPCRAVTEVTVGKGLERDLRY
jgi:hypothetical protein